MDSPIFTPPTATTMATSDGTGRSQPGIAATWPVAAADDPAARGAPPELDLAQFGRILAGHLARLIPLDNVCLLFDQRQDVLSPLDEQGNHTIDWIMPLRPAFIHRARLHQGITVIANGDLLAGSAPPGELTAEAEPALLLIVPLYAAGHLTAALIGRRRGDRQFTAGEREIAEVLRDQAELTLVVLANAERPPDGPFPPARGIGAAERTTLPVDQGRPLDLLVELAGMTSDIPDLPSFLDGVTRMVQRRLGYQDVRLLLTDAAGKALTVAAHSSAGAPLPIGTTVPIESSEYQPTLADGEARLLIHPGDDTTGVDGWAGRARSELVIPLVVNAEPIGIIDVASTEIAAFGPRDLVVLTAIGGQLAAAIHVAQLHDTTKRAALTDGLTGLANYRAFYQVLEAALAGGESLSVAILDVEGLKRVNDSGGHLAGDAFLRRFAAIIRDTVRPEHFIARYGGDEFVVILPQVSRQRAAAIARVIRRRLELDPINLTGSSIRFGVASTPRDGTTAHELVAAADRRLYAMRARKLRQPREAVLFQTAKVYGFEL